ncbi:energy transducer TonB [Paracrocinitomix mangrovi]|uniref:energy transducer TonB n=1 Tax=Paracrocinitomix mangrovi TaxID=2862509 RepID=UPI001C8EE1E4|nr:energy transducer TonB [Paracrocinitomix mangrovi]UKN00478.1 energy transducer TonB [Paracrocinitomix mangrovi]
MKTLLITTLLTFFVGVQTAQASNDPKLNQITKIVAEKIHYPKNAIQNHEEGTVYVAFKVVDGNVEAEVLEGLSEELNAEALSAVKTLPAAELLNFEDKTYILPIKFELK